MEHIVDILVEEASMKNALEVILPQILPAAYKLNENCFIRPHQGKSDLQKSIRNKVMAYQHYPFPVKLIVIQDQDSNDCIELKHKIMDLISTHNAKQLALIRIACRELENWYLGDMAAIEAVYPTFKAARYINKAKYRNPDNVFGADELNRLVKGFSKGTASKEIPKYMSLEINKSPSFNHFLSGIIRFLSP